MFGEVLTKFVGQRRMAGLELVGDVDDVLLGSGIRVVPSDESKFASALRMPKAARWPLWAPSPSPYTCGGDLAHDPSETVEDRPGRIRSAWVG